MGPSNGEIDHIDLAHGDPFDAAAPLVRVTTLHPRASRLLLTAAIAAHELAEYLWQEGGAPHELVRPTFTSQAPTATWSELRLPVDSHLTAFRSLGGGEFWVALGQIGKSVITVEARRLAPDGTGLATIEDVEAYLAGPRR